MLPRGPSCPPGGEIGFTFTRWSGMRRNRRVSAARLSRRRRLLRAVASALVASTSGRESSIWPCCPWIWPCVTVICRRLWPGMSRTSIDSRRSIARASSSRIRRASSRSSCWVCMVEPILGPHRLLSNETVGVAQALELVTRHAEQRAENVLRIGAELRRTPTELGIQVRKADAVRLGRMTTEHGVLDRTEVPTMHELRVVVQIAEIPDRPRLDPGRLEPLGEHVTTLTARPLRETALEQVDRREPAGDGREGGVLRPGGRPHAADERTPRCVVGTDDGDPALAPFLLHAREDPVWRDVG